MLFSTSNRYSDWQPFLDSIGCSIAGYASLTTLKQWDWVNSPISPESMVLTTLVNTLALYPARQLTQDKNLPPFSKGVVTIASFALGVTLAPTVTTKLLKNQVALITTDLATRIAAFNIGCKIALYVAYRVSAQTYSDLTFPSFENFDKKTPHQIGVLLAHFKQIPENWSNLNLKKQLAFNQMVIKNDHTPLALTAIDLKGETLTKGELTTFLTLTKDLPLDHETATVLYLSKHPPEKRTHKTSELPNIDPKKTTPKNLTEAEVRWHHSWLTTHPSTLLSPLQRKDFALRFYDLDLPSPSPQLVAKLPFPATEIGMTANKASYFSNFYEQNPTEWRMLHPKKQFFFNQLFKRYSFDTHPL